MTRRLLHCQVLFDIAQGILNILDGPSLYTAKTFMRVFYVEVILGGLGFSFVAESTKIGLFSAFKIFILVKRVSSSTRFEKKFII